MIKRPKIFWSYDNTKTIIYIYIVVKETKDKTNCYQTLHHDQHGKKAF